MGRQSKISVRRKDLWITKDGEILPDIAVTTEHVTGSVQWYEGSDDTGTPVNAGTRAKGDQVYTAYVTFKPETGYRFGTGEDQAVNINVIAENTDGDKEYPVVLTTEIVVRVTFLPVTPNEFLPKVQGSIPGFIAQQELPDLSIATEHVTGSVQWYEGSDDTGTPVDAGTLVEKYQVYTAYVTLEAMDGYSFGDGVTRQTEFQIASENAVQSQVTLEQTTKKAVIKITYNRTKNENGTYITYYLNGLYLEGEYEQTPFELLFNLRPSFGTKADFYASHFVALFDGKAVAGNVPALGLTPIYYSFNSGRLEVNTSYLGIGATEDDFYSGRVAMIAALGGLPLPGEAILGSLAYRSQGEGRYHDLTEEQLQQAATPEGLRIVLPHGMADEEIMELQGSHDELTTIELENGTLRDGEATAKLIVKCTWNEADIKTYTVHFEVDSTHTWGSCISNGDGRHSRTCSECRMTETKSCSGGIATCIEKAVCDICGEEYGEINASNHTNLVKIEAKPATHMEEGNIEYWYCNGCNKAFSDESGTQEIALADTVTPKLTGHTADSSGWHFDETSHWNTCECGEKLNEAAHTFDTILR